MVLKLQTAEHANMHPTVIIDHYLTGGCHTEPLPPMVEGPSDISALSHPNFTQLDPELDSPDQTSGTCD